MKAQISIEYLILIAAVLAIVAIVVIMLTNVFQGQQSDLQFQMCREAAASCALSLKQNPYASCNSCIDQCKDVRDNTDILSREPINLACSNPNSACGMCKRGLTNRIQAGSIAPATNIAPTNVVNNTTDNTISQNQSSKEGGIMGDIFDWFGGGDEQPPGDFSE